jgi:hypothetical protein
MMDILLWCGLGGVGATGLLALAWFFPFTRKYAIAAAGILIAASAIYAKGNADARRRKQAEWDAAERKMVDRSNEARAAAEREYDAGGLPDDEFDRDQKQVRRP